MVSSAPHSQNFNQPLRKTPFSFQRIYPEPQLRELERSFEARMQEYMASRAERLERFEKAIFKQTNKINGRMAKMFGLLKELTSSTTPKKVLVREEIRNPITENVNAIFYCRIESEKAKENNEVIDKNITEHGKCSIKEPVRITNKEPLGEEIKMIEPPEPQPVSNYLKHKINKDLIEGLIENQRSGKNKMSFYKKHEPLREVERKTKNNIEPITPTTTVYRLALEWEKRIKLHQKKEIEFDQWRSKIFNKRWPTPIKEEFEVRTEGGVEGW
ncbi:hypothetical protein Tco_0744066 [Tanacetum coccineum]